MLNLRNEYHFKCYRKGCLLWAENIKNLRTTEGKNFLLDTFFDGSAYTAAWKMGLISSLTTLAVGDIYAQIGGTNDWTEFTDYSGSRPSITFGSASGTIVGTADFTFTGSGTLNGAFVADTAVLFSETAFSASHSVVSSDELTVTITYGV